MTVLADRLAALREKYASMLKPEFAARMERHIEELRSNGSADQILKPGRKAPAFVLKDQNGNVVSSTGLLAGGPLVVSFYRGTWCPYCNEEIRALDDAYAQIREAGAELVVLTPQSAANAKEYRDKHPVAFPVLVDEDQTVAAAFGLVYTFPDYLMELYKNVFGNDLSLINVSGTWQLPIPARFVIASDGTIVDVKTDPDYRYRPDPSETVAVLRNVPTSARAEV
jgi:peroxiredoxin